MISLKRKRMLRSQARAGVDAVRKTEAVSRTTQVAHSTVAVGDADVPVVDVANDATNAAAELPVVQAEVGRASEDAYQASIEVTEALDAAEGAAVKAAAATETALGFARYSQIDGGEIFPPLPEDGPRQGAELVLIDVNAHPYQVNVWNGTAWAPSRLLLDQVLFLSPEGTVQIGNGTLVAPTVIGGEFYGNSFEGGLFTLASVASETIVANDTFESSVSPWERADPGYTVPTRSTAQAQSGSASMLLGRNGAEFGAFRAIPATSFPNGGYISMWVRRSAAGTVALGADNSFVQTPLVVEANTWTELRRTLPPGSTVSIMWILGTLPDSGGAAYADSVRVVKYNTAAGLAAVDRDSAGRARVYSIDAAGDVSGLRDGRAYSAFKNGAIEYSSEMGPIPGGGLGTQGVQQVLKQVSASRTAELKVQMWSTGAANFVSSATDRTQSQIAMTDEIMLRGTRIMLDGPVEFQGDTDWVAVTIPGGTGTCRWMRLMGIIYLQFDITYSTSLAAGSALTPGFTLPVAARPVGNTPIDIIGASTVPAFAYVAAATGNSAIRNTHTASVARFIGGGQWPASA